MVPGLWWCGASIIYMSMSKNVEITVDGDRVGWLWRSVVALLLSSDTSRKQGCWGLAPRDSNHSDCPVKTACSSPVRRKGADCGSAGSSLSTRVLCCHWCEWSHTGPSRKRLIFKTLYKNTMWNFIKIILTMPYNFVPTISLLYKKHKDKELP
jgi:hypothetical protein